MIYISQPHQTIASEQYRILRLLGLQVPKTRTPSRDINLNLRAMALNEFIAGFVPNGGGTYGVFVIQEDTNSGINNNCFNVPVTGGNNDSVASLVSAANADVAIFILTNFGVAPASITWMTNPSSGAKTYNFPSLAVNTARQPSMSYDTFISASVPITATLSLTTGQQGTVTLQYADDSAFTTNVVSVQPSSNGNTGTLAIGLGLGQIVSATVSGIIPAGKYYRLLTTNVTGTPTYGTPIIEEVVGV